MQSIRGSFGFSRITLNQLVSGLFYGKGTLQPCTHSLFEDLGGNGKSYSKLRFGRRQADRDHEQSRCEIDFRNPTGVVIVSLLCKDVQSRGIHHRQHHGPEKISRVTSFNLNTTNMFGLYLDGPYSITDTMRNELKNNLIKAYTRTNCNAAMHDNCEILIARHRGNFGFNYDHHYDNFNGFAYGNSVTEPGSTLGNDFETSSSRTERSANCPTGSPFDCSTASDDKKITVQKCWLYDLYSGTHQARGFTLHTVQYTQGQDLKWSDISSYLRLLGERLLPDHASDMVEDFYTTIYSQIICEIGNINTDTNKQIVNIFYQKYADLIRKMHIRFHHLRYARDDRGAKQNCFDELLQFMNTLTALASSNQQSWEDIMLQQTKFINEIDMIYNQNSQPETNFCLQRILVEYSALIRDRAETNAEILSKVKQDYCSNGRNCDSDDQYIRFEHSFNSNRDLLYGMTYKIYEDVAKVLYKAVLTTNPHGRLSSETEEDRRVDTATDGLLGKATNLDNPFDPESFWTTKLGRLNKKITKEKQQAIQTV
ncbi:hypothetical protein ACHWQZ_G016876 [Mnemiopsis leidyi]